MIRGLTIALLIAVAITGSIVALVQHGADRLSRRTADVEYEVYSAAIPHFMRGVRERNDWMDEDIFDVE